MISGLGVDAIEVERVAAAITRTPRLLDRLWTPREQVLCGRSVERLAARFAGKEAIAKALGTGIRGFAFTDIEILSNDLGRPTVILRRGAAALHAGPVHLSLTTIRALVVAVAVLER